MSGLMCVAVVLAVAGVVLVLCALFAAGEQDDQDARSLDRCVMCGEPVPEGRIVCPVCERKIMGDGD